MCRIRGHRHRPVPDPDSLPGGPAAMAQKSDSRDSDNSWVLTGTEGLPVDTVGPERDSASQDDENEEEGEEEGDPDAGTADGTEDGAASLGEKQHPEDAEERSDPDAGTELPPSGPTELSAAGSWEEEKHNAEPGARAEGPLLEEGSCTSSDDDVEGLRRRQVHQPRAGTPPPAPIPRRVLRDEGNEEGLSANKLLLGALALVAVALLIVTGGFYDTADGPADAMSSDATDVEQEAVPDNGSDSPQKPPLDGGDVRSMQSMSVLLDRLAKENQDIRLMQAELQTHKEELQALLQQSEGAAAAAGEKQQSLAKENAELRAALQREAEALRAARAELQRLQPRGGPSDPQPHKEQPHGPSSAVHGEGARHEARHRGLLESVQHELAAALQRAQGAGGLEGLKEELRELEERLSRELGGSEGAEAFPGHWKKGFKAEKKERGWHKRDGHRERGKAHGKERHSKEHHGKEHHGKEHHGKEPRPHREHREGKSGGKWSRGPRELPPLSHPRAPQGCSGVTDCAHKEGREALGAALEPVQKSQFLQLLEGFMGRLGWGGHFRGVAERLDGAFGADGVFAHDRRRFVDFVEEVEEMLEDVARRERGDEEAADGFEEFVLQHYAGSVGKERGRKSWRQHGGGR
ncbi:pre-B-cell leukemia transcription factor-interacting protein 1 isoform X2 [Tympanuchus pallidicinctus]|uniref:pre-B-cell leukemia transcription factor-interacting protein 1 isoform X2 n=1 Tax=Tympanuchus pallidicinctus TaxID=109042 RepID=UPI0022872B34|nr:pre-B-cell leukemia transcription factor-interacting protein 1 isoform X2 [Tympanuchus pallidicinctus]